MDALASLATIPYFTLGPWEILGIKIQGFGLMCAIGVTAAYNIASWLAPRHGLSRDKMQSMLLALLITGFLGSHVIDLLLYHPKEVWEDPLILFKFGSTLSSYGGVIGSLLGLLWWKIRFKEPVGPYLDAAAFALPAGWLWGRIGCTVVHDHPGDVSDFALAIVMKDGIARHDLGFYEALWWVVILGIFWTALMIGKERWQQRPGFFLALLPIVYAPIRFFLDFARTNDSTYFGLTPAQYISILALLVGFVLMYRWATKMTLQLPLYVPSPDDDTDDDDKPVPTGPTTKRKGKGKGKRR
jgi:phosphatidylglycerol---prolipoprotein diacylglyceryl transferase